MRSLLIAALLASGVAAAQQAGGRTAADVTEPGRDIARCLDVVLASVTTQPGARTLLLAVDPSAALAQAAFDDELERALARAKSKLGATRLALASLAGKKRGLLVSPTADHASVVAALRELLATPGAEIENVFAELRPLAAAAATWPGARELLVVTLENGDAEDQVEASTDRLRRAGLRTHVLTSESYFADSYWAARPHEQGPRGTELAGGDAPYIDLPWGFLLQTHVANEITPSGFGPYALTRLAAATEGRVFLFTKPGEATHRCSVYQFCLFCNGDHVQPRENYLDARLRQVAAPSGSRAEAARELGSDPAARAVLRAWSDAARAGLVRSHPPLQLAGTTASPASPRGGGTPLPILDGLQFERNAKHADRGADDCERIGKVLARDLEQADAAKTLPRQLAIAELVRLDLQLLRVNLLLYAAWCRDVAPAKLAEAETPPAPPEVAELPPGARATGITFSNHCLCHGVTPFLAVELPGGEAVRAELRELDRIAAAFRERWAGTPLVAALHRSGIARFHLAVPGTLVPPPRVRPKSASERDTTTTGQTRPPRTPPASGTGTPTGPTTGGGR